MDLMQSVVTIVNLSEVPFVEKFDSRKFKLGPKSKGYAPAEAAMHWFGTPTNDLKEWQEDLKRLSLRNEPVFSLIQQKKLFVDDWKDQYKFGYDSGFVPPDEMELAGITQHGIPLTEEELASFLPQVVAPEDVHAPVQPTEASMGHLTTPAANIGVQFKKF